MTDAIEDGLVRVAHATAAEARRLASMVQAGQITRAQLEDMRAETGDGEPAIALVYLDAWEANGRGGRIGDW